MKRALCLFFLPLSILAQVLVKSEDHAIPPDVLDAVVPLDSQVVEAIERAQVELAGRQKGDGSWRHNQHGEGNVGEISFAILALMVNGSVPGEGRFGKNISLGLQYLLNRQDGEGLICGPGKGQRMYEHALGTLALSEGYGMSASPRIRNALIRAVDLIVSTQHEAGGWRYQPKPEPGDISVTVMQVMALRSAADAGIFVPEKTFKRAAAFIGKCYNPKKKGFSYMADPNGGIAFARTAAGLVSLQSLGLYGDKRILEPVPYLLEKSLDEKQDHFWYGHYYASVALYHLGGMSWQNYYPKARQLILKKWSDKDGRHWGGTLNLAWQIMVLGVPYRYMPIYQR